MFSNAITSSRQFRQKRRMSEVKTQLVNEAIKKFIGATANDQAFYIADFSDVVYKRRYWRNKLPRVEAFYAVKCNPDAMLLRLMVALGMRFDCASQGEINAVLAAGAHPSDIIYAHPFKSSAFLRYAAAVGVDLMTFDAETELRRIAKVFPHARLVLRIRIPDVPAGFPLSDKFGCELKQSRHLLQVARGLKLNVVGVSFHVGSLCEQPSAFKKAIGMARQVFDTAADLGMHFTLLDLGGGFPGATGTYNTFDEMCYFINEGLAEYFPEGCGVQVIAEPGCYMVCSAYTLCTKVIGKKVQDSGENNDGYGRVKKISYYLNDGVYGSFAYGFEKYGFHIKPLLSQAQLARRPVVRSKLWGATCCSSDCIIEDCLLPELSADEYIVFDNMGAYTQCLTTTFNGFPLPATHYIFPPQSMYQNDNLPEFEEFCHELGSNKLKAFIKIQEYICHDDSNDDLYRKG